MTQKCLRLPVFPMYQFPTKKHGRVSISQPRISITGSFPISSNGEMLQFTLFFFTFFSFFFFCCKNHSPNVQDGKQKSGRQFSSSSARSSS